ncbi:hypothetical protein MKZ24_19330 [Paenibacillus sp. FSL R7-0297]|uniref:hypothetical protein n=1 Tax=Paenibacillus sp. FSL R7-0297 TaxID=2921680 RepID=UPI0030F5B201
MNLKIYSLEKVAEEIFGAVGAEATAFVYGFPPRTADKLEKSGDGQRPEVQIFSAVTVIPK